MFRAEQYQDMAARLWPELHTGGRSLSKPITFCVTSQCQLRCTYCYETGKGEEVMDLSTAKKFIDAILTGDKGLAEYITVDGSPAVVLEFIGGEPLLHPQLISDILDYWMDTATAMMHPWAERFMVSICSNGVAYFDPAVLRLLTRWRSRLSFSVTIDGNRELHDACRIFPDGRGSYDMAIAAAKHWMDNGGIMGSKLTIAPGNVDHLADAVSHMMSLGYDEINANCVYEQGWTLEHARVFYDQLLLVGQKLLDDNVSMDEFYLALFEEIYFRPKLSDDVQNWCGGNGVMIACGPDGRIYPCIRYMEMSLGDTQPPIVLGNVDDGILTKQCERECYDCLRAIDRRTQSDDECFFCPIAEGCSWCTAYNYQEHGTPDSRAKHICVMHKARALANAWFWPRYYKQHGISEGYTLYVPDDWALDIITRQELTEIKEHCDATSV